MAVANWVRAEIDAVVEEWLRQRRIFTAYEVSRQVRADGVKVRHRELRDDVHDSLQLASGRYGYTRTLRDVGGVEAWLYHHWKDNAWSHTPLPRDGANTTATSYTSSNAALDETAPYDSPLLPATSPAYSGGVAVAALPDRQQHITETRLPAPVESRLKTRPGNVTQLELRPDETAVVVCNQLETDVIIHNAKPTSQGSPLQQEMRSAGQWLMSWAKKILDC